MTRTLTTLAGLLLAGSVAQPVRAEVVPTEVRESPLVLGAGATYRGQTYRGYSDSDKWRALPLVLWEGERFFFRGANGGWKAYADESWELALLAQFRGDGYDSDDADILEGMDDRDPSIDGGAQVTWRSSSGLGLRGAWLADLTGTHEGWEARGQFFYTHISENGRWLIEPSAALVYQSEDLVDYYYGVQADEAIPGFRDFYEADAELIYRFQTVAMWNPGGSKLQLLFGARFDLQGDEFDQSPITDDEKFWMGFFAAGYRF